MIPVAKVIVGPGEKRRRKDSDSEKCILCNKRGKERLIDNPSDNAYEKMNQSITNLANYKDEHCMSVLKQLNGDASVPNLKFLEVKWHLNCYKSLTHTTRRTSAENKFISVDTNTPIDEQLNEPFSTPFTRQQLTSKYNKDLCFFVMVKTQRSALYIMFSTILEVKI